VPAVICSVDDLRYDSTHRRLCSHDADGHRQPITVVHRRALLNDLLSRYGPDFIDHPLPRAWSAGACIMVNSFTSQLSTKKSALTLFADPRTSVLLSPQEAAAAQRYLPWTRLVRPGSTTYRGEEIDLSAFARTHREGLVLKPNDDYGGQGIVCGWQTSDEDWQKALSHAMNDPHVIQERIPIPRPATPPGQTAACASRPTTKALTRSCSLPRPTAASVDCPRPLCSTSAPVEAASRSSR
jgi:hypothetical protein